VIFGSKPRFRGRSGRSGPVMRGMGTLGRAFGVAWRRSLQLRVLALTLGMSVADWWRVTNRAPNALFIRDVDDHGLYALLEERLARLP